MLLKPNDFDRCFRNKLCICHYGEQAFNDLVSRLYVSRINKLNISEMFKITSQLDAYKNQFL